jgi:hypothetical protein
MDEPRYTAMAMPAVTNPSSRMAVILIYGRMSGTMSIDEARQLSLVLARAADQAELQAKN